MPNQDCNSGTNSESSRHKNGKSVYLYIQVGTKLLFRQVLKPLVVSHKSFPQMFPKEHLLTISHLCSARNIKGLSLHKNPQMFLKEHLWKSISNLVSPFFVAMACPSDYPALKSGIANAQSISIFWRSSLGFS
jgi:hypothetical protein